MKRTYNDSLGPIYGHIICYACNKFAHQEKEYRNKPMNLHKKHGKQLDKNILTKISKKYGSSNTSHNKQKEDEETRCGLSLCSFEDEEEWYIDSRFSSHDWK